MKRLPPRPWTSPHAPPVVDHLGREVKRVGYASLRRVLDAPVNFKEADPDNYAMFSCPGLGLAVTRDGHRPHSAEYTLSGNYPTRILSRVGPAGRDEIIKRFLGLYRRRYSCQFPAAWCERTLAPVAERINRRRKKK